MNSLLVIAAALWGAAAGALLPRAAYRFSVPSGESWRDTCPGGHPVGGWVGRARCGECGRGIGTRGGDSAVSAAGEDGDSALSAAAEDGDSAVTAAEDGDRAALAPDADSAAPAPDDESPAPAPDNDTAVTAAADDADTAVPKAAYGPSAPLLSLVTALLCVALAAATGMRPEIAVWLLLAPVGVLLAVVDFRVQRLPDVLTLPLAAAALALLGLVALVPEHAGDWVTALLGALALGGGFFVLFLINPGGMGFGDVKLALGLGAVLGWYGWPTLMLGTFAAFLLGALYGGALVVARRAGRKTAIPFGPFLIAGAYVGLLIGAYAA